MSNFCTNILLPNNYKSQTVIREMLRKTLMYIKFARLMLMKLTPGPAMAAIKAHPRIAAMLTPILLATLGSAFNITGDCKYAETLSQSAWTFLNSYLKKILTLIFFIQFSEKSLIACLTFLFRCKGSMSLS